jgi:hypothetical protein
VGLLMWLIATAIFIITDDPTKVLATDTSNPTSGWPTPETRSNALPKSGEY